MSKKKWVWCGGRKGEDLGPDPSNPETHTMVRYSGGDLHRERNSDLRKTKPKS